MFIRLGSGSGQMVSMQAFHSDDHNSNSAEHDINIV